jgi:hypothetical protein
MPSTFIGSVSLRGGDALRRSRERTSGVYIDCERKKASPGSYRNSQGISISSGTPVR